MPLVRFDLSSSWDASLRAAIGDGVHAALVAAFAIPEGDRFQITTVHEPGELVFHPSFLGVERQDVIFIQVLLVRKQTPEAKLHLYQEISARLAVHGVRKEDLFISLVENGPEDWTAGQR